MPLARNPKLVSALASGLIRTTPEGEYIGTAGDGNTVTFGTAGLDDDAVEAYLTAHPTPDTW